MNKLGDFEIVTELRSYDDLHHAMRARAEELNVSRETLDAVSGVQSGYSSKLLSPDPNARDEAGRRKGKRIGWDLLSPFMGALALKLLIAKDPEGLARLRHRLTRRQIYARPTPIGLSPEERARELFLRMCSRGGEARSKAMTEPERIEFARRGGEARREALSSWRRKEIAQNAAIARWAAAKRASKQASKGISA